MSIIELQPALVQRIIYPWYKSLELLSPVELHKFAMFLGTVLYTCRILRQNLSNEVNFKDFWVYQGSFAFATLSREVVDGSFDKVHP